jgi:GNAT superfamily N-acetyltransferase
VGVAAGAVAAGQPLGTAALIPELWGGCAVLAAASGTAHHLSSHGWGPASIIVALVASWLMFIAAQGLWVSLRVPRLPRAPGPQTGTALVPEPARIAFSAAILKLRQRAMWPDKPLEFSSVDGDSTAQHYGVEAPRNSADDGSSDDHVMLLAVVSVWIAADRKQAQFRKFCTDEAWRGRGLGSSLLRFALHALRVQGVERVWCNARVEQVGFYARHFGMVEVTGSEFSRGGRDYIIMENCTLASVPVARRGHSADAGVKRHLRLLVFGDSVACSVGCRSNGRGLAGICAQALALQTRRNVDWTVVAESGLTASAMRGTLVPKLRSQTVDGGSDQSPPWDLCLLSVGVNHILAGHTPPYFATQLRELLDALGQALGPQCAVMLAGLPPLESFPALPWPLNMMLGFWASGYEVSDDYLATFCEHKRSYGSAWTAVPHCTS